jgi:hypothetical protein
MNSKKMKIFLLIFAVLCSAICSAWFFFGDRGSKNYENYVWALKSDPYEITIKYRPTQYFLQKLRRQNRETQDTSLSVSKNNYEKGIYFHISISPLSTKGNKSYNGDIVNEALYKGNTEFHQRLDDLSYRLQENIWLRLPDGEMIHPSACNFIRNFELGNGRNDVMVVFARKRIPKNQKKMKMVFSNIGNIKGNVEVEIKL